LLAGWMFGDRNTKCCRFGRVERLLSLSGVRVLALVQP
jgi:hypothetical protein